MKRILALGFFDGVHLGHQALLARTRELADANGAAACAITFDRSPGKGGALTTLSDRVRLLKTLGQMDEVLVLPFDETLMRTPCGSFLQRLITAHGACAFVCGADYRFGAGAAGNAALLQRFCAENGLPCAVLPALELDGSVVSSTRIKALIAEGETEQAMRLYGHPHTLSGTVAKGRGVGRTFGIPTANLVPEAGLVLPKYGVYAVRAACEGRSFTGVCNVGLKPTFQGEGVTVETWLEGETGDLYGKPLTVDFYCFLRPERRFESVEALKAEILQNRAEAAEYFVKLG